MRGGWREKEWRHRVASWSSESSTARPQRVVGAPTPQPATPPLTQHTLTTPDEPLAEDGAVAHVKVGAVGREGGGAEGELSQPKNAATGTVGKKDDAYDDA